MGWRVEVGENARRQLARLDPVAARRIVEFLRTRILVADDPRRFGEPLKGSRLGGFWRYRIGDFRVIAAIEDDAFRVLVVQIGHRRDVYR